MLNWLDKSLSGLGQVEGGGFAGAESDFHALAVVGVHGQAGRSQNHGNSDAAAGGVVDGAAAHHAVDVQLHGRARLRTLDHVLDHPVGQVAVVIGGVHRGGTRAVGEAGDVAAEGGVLTHGLADGGHVDFGPGDFKAPFAHGTHHCRGGVVDLESVGNNSSSVVGDGNAGTAESGGNSQCTSSGGVADYVVNGACGQSGRKGARASSAGFGVDYAELDGIADFKVQVGRDSNDICSVINVSLTEGCGGASRGVVEGAGGARQDGGHWSYQW